MPNTTKMMWPFPAEDQDPWYATFASMVAAIDASGYAAREDRQLLLGGGGIVEFTASSGLLTWGGAFEIFSPIAGFVFTIPAGSVTLTDGQIAYATVTRSPTQNLTIGMTVADTVPNTDGALIFGIRRGSAVYWRNGSKSNDGIPGDIFAGGGGGGTDPNAVHVNASNEIATLGSVTPDAADVLLIEDQSDGFSKKSVTVGSLGAGGEANTASSVGVGGVAVFKQKTGVDLEFKSINAGEGIAVTDDVANNEVDVELDINGLTAEASPDGANDYIAIYDASAVAHRKVLIDNLPTGSGLPATSGFQFAALIEDPANTPVFKVLTQDMIQPAFVVTLNLDGTNTFEVGNSIVNPSFTVSYANGTLVSATIDDGAGPSPGVALISPYTAGTIPETYSSSAGAAANGEQQVFDVSATSTLGITKGDTDTATWLPRVFWDDIPDAAYTEAFIEAMAGNELRASRSKTISYNTGVGEYMFYAFPTDYGGGTPTFKDQATGFDAGFSQVAASVSVTNGFGNTQTYEIWRSNNANLGARTIVVS